MLASSRRDYPLATVATQRVTGESTKETLKPLRREGRTASAEPVCSCAFSYVQLAHETAGAACTRSSLRPLLRVACALFFLGEGYLQNSGSVCRENDNPHLVVPAPRARLRTRRGRRVESFV